VRPYSPPPARPHACAQKLILRKASMDGAGMDALEIDELLLGDGASSGAGVGSLDDLFSLLPEADSLSVGAGALEAEAAAAAAAAAATTTAAAAPLAAAAGSKLAAGSKRSRSAAAPAARGNAGASESSASEACEEDEEAAKKRRRLEKNRQSAQLSRERKRNQIDRLQAQVQQLQHDNCSLAYTLSVYHAELQRMHEQLAKVTGGEPPRALPMAAPVPNADVSNTKGDGNDNDDDDTTTHKREHPGKDKPAVLTEMPSIFLVVAISTLLQAASCYLAGSLCLNSVEAVGHVRVYGASCAEQARVGSLRTWQMDARTGADLTLPDGAPGGAG